MMKKYLPILLLIALVGSMAVKTRLDSSARGERRESPFNDGEPVTNENRESREPAVVYAGEPLLSTAEPPANTGLIGRYYRIGRVTGNETSSDNRSGAGVPGEPVAGAAPYRDPWSSPEPPRDSRSGAASPRDPGAPVYGDDEVRRRWNSVSFGPDVPGRLLLKRVDPIINFVWTGKSPAPRLPGEEFQVTWSGFVKAPVTRRYLIQLESDDGARMHIDGRLLIDDWVVRSSTATNLQATMKEGWHRIRIEYFQGPGETNIHLRWNYPNEAQLGVIPADCLGH